MKYIIDGYNWFFAYHDDIGDFSDLQALFVYKIVNNLKKSKNVFTIVFDGSGEVEFESYGSNIQIIYTEKSQSADEFIIETLEFDKNKMSTVVTSDSELIRNSKQHGASVLSVNEFIKKEFLERDIDLQKPQNNKYIKEICNEFYIEIFTKRLKKIENKTDKEKKSHGQNFNKHKFYRNKERKFNRNSQ